MKHGFLSAVSLVLVTVLLVPALFSCSKLSEDKEAKETVMKIGSYEVPFELYRYVALNFRKDYPGASEKELKEKTEDALLDMYAVLACAKESGIDPDGEYFDVAEDNALKHANDQAGGNAELLNSLAGAFMNESVFRFLSRKSAVNEELYAKLSSEALDKFEGDAGVSLVMSDEFACVKQVLVTVGERSSMGDDFYFVSADTHTRDEAASIADGVYEKALAGEDFDALVEEYSESLYMIRNTDGYYLCRGQWEKINEDAVFALAPGEISGVIESEAGFSIFLRCEKDEKYVEKNLGTISENYAAAYFNSCVEKARGSLTVETTEKYDTVDIISLEFKK